MIEVTQFEIATGKITGMFQSSAIEYIQANAREGYSFVDGSYSPDDYYFVASVLTERPDMAIVIAPASIKANNTDTVTVSGLPNGDTEIRLFGPVMDSWTESGTSFELTTNMAGMFLIEIDHWPYKKKQVSFNAT